MSAPRAIRSALALSSDAEKAAILDEFVVADHELEDRAERAARFRLAQVETGEVASAVTAALLALDQEDLAANAGRTRYGYVEPTEAACCCSTQPSSPGLRTSHGGRASASQRPRAASALGSSRHSNA
jgi:hypothetical protein